MRLETDRTVLRHFEEKDLEDLYDYCSQDGVGEMAGWKHHESLSTSKEVLKRNIQNSNVYAIENKENGKVIGHIAVNNDSENGREDTKELGFALNRDYHNKGIMTEVTYKILDYLFSNEIEYVYACCFQDNKSSKRLIEKCGFTLEQEGSFYSESLDKTFKSYEYVYSKNNWKLQNKH
ncbi:GNAT family N-acetyltransferase [Clostridium sp. 'White wine YQ']|uniref:GNAT family N-acetyltransferase n=1 Tax=Clostridium sp. 'White wine YQ' TaxID=3027474 RepID=UPI002366149C|nr:GNAT family protein [Clostridium sp. 'White wine YQ']MDD7793473.1 GNAT family protein [Clostridium sp. 'White wine YQ']